MGFRGAALTRVLASGAVGIRVPRCQQGCRAGEGAHAGMVSERTRGRACRPVRLRRSDSKCVLTVAERERPGSPGPSRTGSRNAMRRPAQGSPRRNQSPFFGRIEHSSGSPRRLSRRGPPAAADPASHPFSPCSRMAARTGFTEAPACAAPAWEGTQQPLRLLICSRRARRTAPAGPTRGGAPPLRLSASPLSAGARRPTIEQGTDPDKIINSPRSA